MGIVELEDPENVCRQVYRDTKAFYAAIDADCGHQGFQILYGPPVRSPSILFLGYQPGRGTKTPEQERADGSEDRWPERSEYLTEPWALARNLRSMFGEEILERSVGMNAIFVRSPTVADYMRVPREVRRRVLEFCIPNVVRMIGAMSPTLIVSIGLETLRLFSKETAPIAWNAAGRVLATRGSIDNRLAIATLHLSGARISVADRATIRETVLKHL